MTKHSEATPLRAFAKVFDTPSGQLLVRREYDTDDDAWKIRLSGQSADGVDVTVSLGGWTDDEAASLNALNITDQAMADKNAADLVKMIAGAQGDGSDD